LGKVGSAGRLGSWHFFGSWGSVLVEFGKVGETWPGGVKSENLEGGTAQASKKCIFSLWEQKVGFFWPGRGNVRNRPDRARSGPNWPELAQSGPNWPELARTGPNLARTCPGSRIWSCGSRFLGRSAAGSCAGGNPGSADPGASPGRARAGPARPGRDGDARGVPYRPLLDGC